MKRLFTILTVLLIQLSFTGVSQAESERMQKQGAAIEQGLESGQISDKEAQSLERSQEGISKMHEKATQDGSVSKSEARRLNKATRKSAKGVRKANNN